MSFNAEKLQAILKTNFDKPNIKTLVIAYSGGLDSTVLLHAMSSLRSCLKLDVVAVHVNHSLHENSKAWAEHCKNFCKHLDVNLTVLTIDVKLSKDTSPEEAARNARYKSLHSVLTENKMLLTAHHRDDQAETVILQMLRGSGTSGLASMPALNKSDSIYHARPLLDFSKKELFNYASEQKLSWITDDSNLDVDIDRNFIRREVIPTIKKRWPSFDKTLSRVARNQARADTLLHVLASKDFESIFLHDKRDIDLRKIKELSFEQQQNVIRFWVKQNNFLPPSESQVREMIRTVIVSDIEKTPCIVLGNSEVRRYRNKISIMAPLKQHDPQIILKWSRGECLNIPNLDMQLAWQDLQSQCPAILDNVEVRFRLGGESCRPRGRKQHHSLKKLMQEEGIPSWERDRIPLVYHDEKLRLVWGYWECL
ncbi:MAG: tRNA lysidine(34) synthetase TilS [Pseudomonadota bacterium]